MREKINDYMTVDRKNGRTFYIKEPIDIPGKIERWPPQEYKSYQVLKPYFPRMPRVKMVGETLVIEGIKGETLAQIMETNFQKALESIHDFTQDTFRMWEKTKEPMDETKIVRNIRTEQIKAIESALREPRIKEIADKKLFVNGIEYPTLLETTGSCLKKLESKQDPVMVLTHGDEHFENIIVNGKGYYLFDPRKSGFNSPGRAINCMVGSNYIFFYHWQKDIRVDGKVEIDFEPTPQSRNCEEYMRPVFNEVNKRAEKLSGGELLTKEYLFANLLRVSVGNVMRPRDLTEVFDNGLMYAGLATELYYRKDLL